MSDTALLRGTPTLLRDDAFWAVLGLNVGLGAPAYFISFLFAYGFRGEVGPVEHLTFLVLITMFASVCGLVGAVLNSSNGMRAGRRVRVCLLVSLALNAAVVGAGSIVSATHKGEGSVSASFSTGTDVLVAATLFGVAAVLAVKSVRARSSASRRSSVE